MNQLLPAGALTDTPLAIALQPVFELIPPEVKAPPPPERGVLLRRQRKFRAAATQLENQLVSEAVTPRNAQRLARQKELVLLYRQIVDAIETDALPPVMNRVEDPRQIALLHRSHCLPTIQVDSHAVHVLMERTERAQGASPFRLPVSTYYQLRDVSYEFDEEGLEKLLALVRFAVRHGYIARDMATDLQSKYRDIQIMHAMGIEDQNQFRIAKSVLEGLASVVVEPPDVRMVKLEALAKMHGQRVGFVPTPPEWVMLLLDASSTFPGLRVLDADAGTGRVADAVAQYRQGLVTTIEIQRELVALLRLKNYPVVEQDFLMFEPASGYERVLIDPPRLNDAPFYHVRHAYEVLKRPGRMVAIMAVQEFERSDPVAMEFYRWFQRVKGKYRDLPESPERVPSGLLIVDRR